MVVVAFSSHQRVVGEGSVNHSPPAHLKKKSFIYLSIYLLLKVKILSRPPVSLFRSKVMSWWLSELRRL